MKGRPPLRMHHCPTPPPLFKGVGLIVNAPPADMQHLKLCSGLPVHKSFFAITDSPQAPAMGVCSSFRSYRAAVCRLSPVSAALCRPLMSRGAALPVQSTGGPGPLVSPFGRHQLGKCGIDCWLCAPPRRWGGGSAMGGPPQEEGRQCPKTPGFLRLRREGVAVGRPEASQRERVPEVGPAQIRFCAKLGLRGMTPKSFHSSRFEISDCQPTLCIAPPPPPVPVGCDA